MLMRWELLIGGLLAEEFVELTLGPGGAPVAATALLYADHAVASMRPRAAGLSDDDGCRWLTCGLAGLSAGSFQSTLPGEDGRASHNRAAAACCREVPRRRG